MTLALYKHYFEIIYCLQKPFIFCILETIYHQIVGFYLHLFHWHWNHHGSSYLVITQAPQMQLQIQIMCLEKVKRQREQTSDF